MGSAHRAEYPFFQETLYGYFCVGVIRRVNLEAISTWRFLLPAALRMAIFSKRSSNIRILMWKGKDNSPKIQSCGLP
jgi:hypothetical protein